MASYQVHPSQELSTGIKSPSINFVPNKVATMNASSIDFAPGTVVYWDLDEIDESKPLAEQLDFLKEDLAQIAFMGGRILDVGWYPSSDQQGAFKILVIEAGDWINPIYQGSAKTIGLLKVHIRAAMAVVL